MAQMIPKIWIQEAESPLSEMQKEIQPLLESIRNPWDRELIVKICPIFEIFKSYLEGIYLYMQFTDETRYLITTEIHQFIKSHRELDSTIVFQEHLPDTLSYLTFSIDDIKIGYIIPKKS